MGVGRGSIDHRVSVGRLQLTYRGVYSVGHRGLTGRGLWMAAILACGPNAVLSHRSAAALWALVEGRSRDVDVTAPGRTRSGQAGIRLHRVHRLSREDRLVRDGIHVTTVARTLLDLAEVVTAQALNRAVGHAGRLHRLDLGAIERLCARSPGRRGLKPLRAALATYEPLTRSELERHFLDVCQEAGLPKPAVNTHAAGFEVDALWQQQQLIVELDGFEFHSSREAFEQDRKRDATLLLAGYRVLRFTWRRVYDEPQEVVAIVREALSASRTGLAGSGDELVEAGARLLAHGALHDRGPAEQQP